MNKTLGDEVERAMQSAGIKTRTFAALVGCHYTTIYGLIKNRTTVVPLRIMQEKIYSVLDFLSGGVASGDFPLNEKLTVAQKTEEFSQLYNSYLNKDHTATP